MKWLSCSLNIASCWRSVGHRGEYDGCPQTQLILFVVINAFPFLALKSKGLGVYFTPERSGAIREGAPEMKK